MAAATPPTPPTPPVPPVNLGQTLNAPQPQPQQAQPARGFFSSLWNGTLMQDSGAAAVQGATGNFSTFLANHQEELTNRVRDAAMQALFRRLPDGYHRLLHLMQTFLNQPTAADLQQIKQLLNGLNPAEIRTMVPNITSADVNALTNLRALLDVEVTDGPPLTLSQNGRNGLQAAADILIAIRNGYEGALIRGFDVTLNDPHGPLHQLRQQLNHPQHGMIPEILTTLRTSLNGRAHPPLKQSKEALENYRNALQRNAGIAEIIPLMQTLHDKMALLLASRNPVPQLTQNQWTQLEQFDGHLQGFLNQPAPVTGYTHLLDQSATPLQMLTAAFNAQHGILEEATGIMVEGIGRGIAQVEALPNRIYQNLFPPEAGPQPQQPPAATGGTAPAPAPAAAPPAPNGNSIPLNSIVDRGQRLLNSILSSAGGAFTQQGIRSLATMAKFIFEKIQDHVQATPEQHHLLQTIGPMVQRLQRAITQSSWEELTGAVSDAFRFMREQQVYLQGWRLPLNSVRAHVSAIPGFLHNIETHQNTLSPLSQRIPQTITDQDILKKAALLKSRASSRGPATFILEKICGFSAADAGYGTIYAESGLSEKKAPEIFRRRLFAKIDQAELGLLSPFIKWSVKRMYYLSLPIFSFFVGSTLDNMLKMARTGMRNNRLSQELLIKPVRNWLAVTSGAYNQVALAPPSEAKDFSAMMEDAIRAPKRNGGLTPRELYAAVAKTAIDTFGPKITFNNAIDRYFNIQIPPKSALHFLNPVVALFTKFCRFLLKTLLFVPQWLGNFAANGIAKIALRHVPLLEETSEKAIESLRSNTPASYATQRLLYRQLQKVLHILQNNLRDDANGIEGSNHDTNIQKVEIANLVEYLTEVLNKSRYRTQDRLNNYIQHRAPLRDRAGKELDDTFIPEVMEHIVKIISTSVKAITQEEELKEILYNGLCIANGSFEDAQPVSDQEFVVMEKGIKELADQVLETAIFYAVNEKFDFTNEKQKRAITQFMQAMKEQSQSFGNQIDAAAREISQDSLSTEAMMDKVTSMVTRSTQFNRERVEALGKADGNRNFHTETKYHLNEISRNMLTHCNPIVECLNSMKTRADQALYLDKLIHPLFLSSQYNRILDSVLQNNRLLPQDMTVCNMQLSLLQQQLILLRQHRCPDPLLGDVQRSLQQFSTSIQKIQELQKSEEILRAIYPLFSQLNLEKQRDLPPATLHQRERRLKDLINTLPSTEQKNRLNRLLGNLMTAQTRGAIEQQASLFFSFYAECNAQNFVQEATHFNLLHSTCGALQTRFDNAIENFTCQVDANKILVQSSCPELIRQATALNTWTQAQHDLPIWNLLVFDMQWLTELVKGLAFDRAHSKAQQLFESLYQRHNYIGLVNQAALLPFLEKFGKHHLKT